VSEPTFRPDRLVAAGEANDASGQRNGSTQRFRIIGADAARAVGRFKPTGVEGYGAATAPNAPLRETRAEAEEDERKWLA